MKKVISKTSQLRWEWKESGLKKKGEIMGEKDGK